MAIVLIPSTSSYSTTGGGGHGAHNIPRHFPHGAGVFGLQSQHLLRLFEALIPPRYRIITKIAAIITKNFILTWVFILNWTRIKILKCPFSFYTLFDPRCVTMYGKQTLNYDSMCKNDCDDIYFDIFSTLYCTHKCGYLLQPYTFSCNHSTFCASLITRC